MECEKKEIVLRVESKTIRSSMGPLILLTAATLLLIFCAHVVVYKREQSLVLLWNVDSAPRGLLLANGSWAKIFRDSFQITRRRGLLFEADVIVFDFLNSMKYQDDVRHLPKRTGQSWVLTTTPKEGFKLYFMYHKLPENFTAQLDLIVYPFL